MPDDSQPVPFSGCYWVIPQQLLAGEYPGDANQDVATKRLLLLLEAGIRTFINLTDEDEISEDAKPVPNYRPLLRQLAEEHRYEISYVRAPIEDRGIPSVWMLRHILDIVDRSLEDENPVYVHCWAGRGRTGTVVGCYLKRKGIATDNDVIRKMAKLRRFMPNHRDESPHAPHQIRMVVNWKKGA